MTDCGVCGTDITNDEQTTKTEAFGTICIECTQEWADYNGGLIPDLVD